MKAVVQYSGGKDSQASLIWAKKNFGHNIRAVYCDTQWENPLTYEHIHSTVKEMGVELTVLKSEGLIELVRRKGRFPSVKARFCTEELKTKVMVDYILENPDDYIIIQGIRKDESRKRSLMEKQCSYFKYYIEPYGKDKKGRPKFHTYRKKEVLEFCKNYAHDVIRPVFDWSAQDVIDYIVEYNQDPNPLYKQGFKRVGCFPCIMCNLGEARIIAQRYPEKFDEIEELEKELDSVFFKIDAIPERYRSKKTINKKGEAVMVTAAKDLREYVLMKHPTTLFEQGDDKFSCSSLYGLCE